MKLSFEHVPAVEDSGKRLLIVLHGLGDSSRGWTWLPRELDMPGLDYLLVDAPHPWWEGFAWFNVDPSEMGGPRVRPPRVPEDQLKASREALVRLIEEQIDAGYLPEQIALLGFSQGCLMALDTGFRFSKKLAGLVGISGWVHDVENLVANASAAGRTVPVLMTHGPADPVIPMAPVAQQARRLQESGFDLVWQEFEKEHTVAGRAEVQFIKRFLNAAYRGEL